LAVDIDRSIISSFILLLLFNMYADQQSGIIFLLRGGNAAQAE
jgi:hypothetical protein